MGVKKKRRLWEIIALVLILLGSAVFRFIAADFDKHLYVYTDELRYYMIADNIAAGNGFSIYNAVSGYQKILYSIFMAPAFLVSDKLLAIKIVALINSVLITSGVIPVWLLSKKLINDWKYRVIVCGMYAVMADMTYSMTFMSEVLFIPMALWALYASFLLFTYEGNSKKKIIYSFMLGVWIYMLYLTKEVALVFPIAYVLLKVAEFIKNYVIIKESQKTHIKEYVKEAIIEIAPMLLAFAVLHIILKVTLFSGLGNSYDQMTFSVLFEEGRIRYLLYGFVYYLCTCVIAFYYVPIIIPLANFKEFSLKEKKYFVFLIFLTIVSAVVVAYTITVREDFDKWYALTPRAHLRYVCYLAVPYFIALFNIGEKKLSASKNHMIKCGIAVGAVSAFLLVFWRGVYDSSSVDEAALAFAQKFNDDQVLIFTAVVGLVGVIFVLLFKRLKKAMLLIFVTAVVATQVWSNRVKISSYNVCYGMTQEEYEETKSVKQIIEQNSDKNFLWIEEAYGKSRRLADTYLNYKNVYTVRWSEIKGEDGRINSNISLRDLSSAYVWAPDDVYNLDEIHYVIVGRDDKLVLDDTVDSNIIISNSNFIVYELKNTNELPQVTEYGGSLLQEGRYTTEEKWPFYSEFSIIDGKIMSTKPGALVYGPYSILPAGKYTITFDYEYEGNLSPEDVVGYVDIFGVSSEVIAGKYQKEIKAGDNQAVIEDIEYIKDVPMFEVRMVVSQADIIIKGVTITKSE